MTYRQIVLIVGSILTIGSSATPILADAAAFLPAKAVCVPAPDGASYIDREELLNWPMSKLWDGHVIPQRVWDLDGKEPVTYKEKLAVLADLEPEDICASGHCRSGDPEAINLMKNSFRDAFNPNLQRHYVVVTPSGQPDEAWRGEANLRAIFDYKKNPALRIKCLDKYKAEEVVYGPELPEEGPDRPNESGVRVSLNRDDLGTSRDELRGIVPAKFSVTSDLKNDGWTWAVEGYAGYRYNWENDNSFGDLIPFVHVVEKTSNKSGDNIDKLGVGIDTIFYRLAFGDVQGGVEYLTDSETDLDILAGQLFWFPAFPGWSKGYINQFDEIGDTGVELKIRPRLTLHGGSVFDRGSNEEIASNSDYLRGGPGVRVQFRGTDGSSFEDFEFSTDAKYLFGIAGDTDDYYRIESSLNYFFPGQDHFSLGLSYTYGYQDETLEKEDLIEAVLGARF